MSHGRLRAQDCAFQTSGAVASLRDYLLFQREMTRADCASWLRVHAKVMPGCAAARSRADVVFAG